MQTKLLVAVLVAAVAAIALWWSFAHGTSQPLPTPSPQPTPRAESPAAASGAATAAESPAATLEANIERTEVPTMPIAPRDPATCTVRGRIVDARGEPRAGVGLEASIWPAPGAAAPAGVEREARTTSGADGRFELPVPTGCDGVLQLRGNELVWGGASPELRSTGGDQDLGDLVAVRGGALQGIVQDEHGRPVAGVKLEAGLGAFAMETHRGTETAVDGSFTIDHLRTGRWSLRTASARYLPTTLEVDLAVEERRGGLVVVVRPGDAIAGQVVDDRGVGTPGVKVTCKRRELQGAMGIERFSSDEAAITDAAGYFTLAGLPKGTVTIRAFGKGHTAVTMPDVPVGTGDLVLHVQRLATIEGLLTATDRTPITGSVIAVDTQAAQRPFDPYEGFGGGPVRAVSAGDGTFRVEGVPPGTVTLRATGAGHLPAIAKGLVVEPGQQLTGVRLVADAGATAHVLVVDDAGEPVVAAKVRAVRAPTDDANGARFVARAVDGADDLAAPTFGGDAGLGTATTAADGTARLPGMPAGPVRFEATHAAFAAAVPVDVTMPASGTTDVRIALRVPGLLAVQVVDAEGSPLAGARVRIDRSDAPPVAPWDDSHSDRVHDVTSDAEGRAHSGPLTPGEYRVALLAESRTEVGTGAVFVFGGDDTIEASTQKVVVEAGRTARVEVRRPVLTRLFGVVTGVDGPMAGCEIELEAAATELTIPGFGDARTTSATDGSFAFDGVEAGTYTLSFGRPRQVVKGRQTVEVPANLAELRQDLSHRTGRLTVRVHDAVTTSPIEGAEVELELDAGEDEPQRRHAIMFATISSHGDDGEAMTMTVGVPRVRTDGNGLATVEDVPAGIYCVRANHQAFRSAEKKGQIVVERQTTDCGRIDLGGAARIHATVKAADGRVVATAVVQHRPVGTGPWSDPQFTNAGSLQLDDLPPGRHVLRAKLPGDAASGPEVEVEVTVGQITPVELRVR